MKNLVLSALSVLFSLGCMAADREIPVGRTVDITGVERIEAFSSVRVHYTQGKGSTVLVKENGTANSEVTVNGKTLCIKLPALEKSPAGVSRSVGGRVVVVGNNSYDVRTEVFVTLPALRVVRNSGSLNFEAERPIDTAGGTLTLENSGSMQASFSAINDSNGSRIDLHNSGSLRIGMDRTAVNEFTMNNSGSLTAEMKSLAADGKVGLHNSGSLRLALPEVTASRFEYSNNGSIRVGNMTVKSPVFKYSNSGSDGSALMRVVSGECSISNFGVMNRSFEVGRGAGDNSARLDFTSKGVAKGSLKFTGGTATMDIDGVCSTDIVVDCSVLNLTASEGSKVSVSGHAANFAYNGSEKSLKTSSLKYGSLTKKRGKNSDVLWQNNGEGEVNQFNP
mgnify:FL=1